MLGGFTLLFSAFGLCFAPGLTLVSWYMASFAIWGYPMLVCRSIPLWTRIAGPFFCPFMLLMVLIGMTVFGVVPSYSSEE